MSECGLAMLSNKDCWVEGDRELKFCESCVMGKQRRLKFCHDKHTQTNIFILIYGVLPLSCLTEDVGIL